MRPDQAPEGGKFRAVAAAAIDGEAGVWGDADLLTVDFDASGDLILGTAGDNCVGVIWTKEGRKPLSDGSENEVIGGKKYTVFTYAEFVEAGAASTPALSEGDQLYGTAAGTVLEAASATAADVYVGSVLGGGERLLININGRPVK